MRISDWSSDVCSSDIVNELLGLDDSRQRNVQRSRSSRPGRAVAPPAAQSDTRSDAGGNSQPERPSTHRLLTAKVASDKIDFALPNGAKPAPVAAPRSHSPVRHPLRSEEHTSELQSLMRTSYAVF